MRAVTWLLFPDARERLSAIEELNTRIRQVQGELLGGVIFNFHRISFAQYYPSGYTTRSEEVDPHLILLAINSVDWDYPALAVWRSGEENQWNFSRVGLRRETLSAPSGQEEQWPGSASDKKSA